MEEKRIYRRFLKIVIGIIFFALLRILFGRVGLSSLFLSLRVIVFRVIIYVAVFAVSASETVEDST